MNTVKMISEMMLPAAAGYSLDFLDVFVVNRQFVIDATIRANIDTLNIIASACDSAAPVGFLKGPELPFPNLSVHSGIAMKRIHHGAAEATPIVATRIRFVFDNGRTTEIMGFSSGIDEELLVDDSEASWVRRNSIWAAISMEGSVRSSRPLQHGPVQFLSPVHPAQLPTGRQSIV